MKRYWTLLVLFVVQLACALFFVGDILASVFGLPIGPMPWELRELLEVGAAFGLIIGVGLGGLALRRALRADGVDTRQLDDILTRLKALDDDRIYKNVQELAELQAAVSEGLRRFEFDLRRKVEGEAGDVRLTGSDDVPAEFKSLVEEYYRSLAKPKAPQR